MGEYTPFREGPLCSVQGSFWQSNDDGPRVEIETKDSLLIYLRLVKAGYGKLEDVRKMNAREVIQALYYEKFISDYQTAYMKMRTNE